MASIGDVREIREIGEIEALAERRAPEASGSRAAGGWRGFARGALEALGIIAAFVAGGLLWAAQLAGAAPAAPAGLYAPDVDDGGDPPRLWLIDGYNLLNVGLLAGRSRESWWSGEHRRELLERVAAFDDPAAELWVVFDGSRPDDALERGRVRAVFAPSADDFLLSRIGAQAGPVALVTADRRLANRARRRGAQVVAPAAFLARCPAVG